MLLSIIIPCFNSERFISATLDMLISQGLSDCEVIVINDGSKDATSEIVRQYAKKYSEIRLLDKENEGVSVARNLGINEAKGKYIYFLDSDDTLTSDTLSFYKKVLVANSEKSFFSFAYCTKNNNHILKNYSVKKYDGQLLENSRLKQSFFTKKLCFHICSCIYENCFLKKNNIIFSPGVKIGEDVEFLLKVLNHADNCKYFSRNCFVYQIREDSTMQGYRTYTPLYYSAFERNRDFIRGMSLCSKKLQKAANFFIINSFILTLYRYIRSDFKDKGLTEKMIMDLNLIKMPVSFGKMKNYIIITMAKVLNCFGLIKKVLEKKRIGIV